MTSPKLEGFLEEWDYSESDLFESVGSTIRPSIQRLCRDAGTIAAALRSRGPGAEKAKRTAMNWLLRVSRQALPLAHKLNIAEMDALNGCLGRVESSLWRLGIQQGFPSSFRALRTILGRSLRIPGY